MRTCPRCGSAHGRRQAYCLPCHADYQREWRKTHPLSEQARFKMNARCYANEYQKRGKLVPQPCEKCGATDVVKHHDDYTKPLDVRWLCRPCHHKTHSPVPLVRRTLALDPATMHCLREDAAAHGLSLSAMVGIIVKEHLKKIDMEQPA